MVFRIKEGALGHKRKVERRAWEDLLKTHEMLMTLTVTVAAEEASTCRGNRGFFFFSPNTTEVVPNSL